MVKWKRPTILLSLAVLIGLLLRVVPDWSIIFSNGYVNFTGPDSYYHIDIMRGLLQDFPHINYTQNLYDVIVVCFAWLVTFGQADINFLEHFVVFIPPLLAAGTTIFVYVIGREVHSPGAGVIAAFTVAILPSELLGRTMLGHIDQHAAEVFLTTGVIMFLVLIGKQKRLLNWHSLLYAVGAILFTIIYIKTWWGYSLFAPVFVVIALAVHKKSFIIVIPLLIIAYLLIGIRMGVASEWTLATTMEALPGWTSYFVVIHVIALAVLLIIKTGMKYRWALIVWAVILIGVTLWQRRFDYYLVIPLALFAGAMLSNYKQKAIAIVIAFILAVVPAYVVQSPKMLTPSGDWHEALEWVKENSENTSVIIAWCDYGYWIRYIAEVEPYVNPGQGDDVKEVARLFNISPREEAPGIIYTENLTYVMIDKRTVTLCMDAISTWDSGRITNDPLAKRLYYKDVEGYELVYDSDVKIYLVR